MALLKHLVFALIFGVLTIGSALAQTSQSGERLILTRDGLFTDEEINAKEQTIRELKEWMASYLEDLPNFICEYSEVEYKQRKPGAPWELEKRYKGEVRFIDGKDEHRVILLNGKPSRKPIWELTGSIDSFATFRFMLNPINNFQFTPNGQGQVSFRSTWGKTLHKGFTKDGTSTGWKSFPSWGTIWKQEHTHAILKIQEHATLHGERWFLPYEYKSIMEYGYFPIDGKRYLLPKREDSTGIMTSNQGRSYRTSRTYENCRRFGADTVIKYGEITDGSP